MKVFSSLLFCDYVYASSNFTQKVQKAQVTTVTCSHFLNIMQHLVEYKFLLISTHVIWIWCQNVEAKVAQYCANKTVYQTKARQTFVFHFAVFLFSDISKLQDSIPAINIILLLLMPFISERSLIDECT